MTDSHKQQWLKSLGLADDKSVIDCDPIAQQITMLINGEYKTRQVVECWSRVMGYHRPVSDWNPGKKSEYKERKQFKEPGGIQ